MAWRRPGDKPLSEPMMVSLLRHICVTQPQWVNTLRPGQDGPHVADDNFKCIFLKEKVQIYWILLLAGSTSQITKTLGLYSLRRRRLTGMGIPMINLRRSDHHFRFIMGIPIFSMNRDYGIDVDYISIRREVSDRYVIWLICLYYLDSSVNDVNPMNGDPSDLRTCICLKQGSWGQHGAHLGPTGPRWAPSWPHELCYLGQYSLHNGLVACSAPSL